MRDNVALQFEDVHKQFHTPRGTVHVLRGVRLTVQPGEFVAITGPSGSGKTTLLTLAGLLDRPTRGTISLQGDPVPWEREADVRRLRAERFGMVFQQFNLLPRRTALENVLFRFRYLSDPPDHPKERAMDTLRALGIADLAHTPVRLLSGGEMQRVGLARTLVHPPHCLLADEPTGNLDADTVHEVMTILQRLHRDGMTILLVTHNPALLPYCTRHVTLNNGLLEEAVVP